MTEREKNILRAAGYSITISNGSEFFIMRKDFDFNNPGKHIKYDEIIKETEYHLGFVEKINTKISNKSFMDRAPENVIQTEFKKLNNSMSIIRRNCETLDYIFNITPLLEKKKSLKKSLIESTKFNDKQKELIINEIEEADEYYIKALEEKIIND